MDSITTATELSLLIFIFAISQVLGCGFLPTGQERILRFNVNGIKLALPMAYTDHLPSRSAYPHISESAMVAQAFVRNLIMRAVNEVLEQQGRSAGLPDVVISAILDQLNINVTYAPLKCDRVSDGTTNQMALRMDDLNNCLVASDIVTSICTKANAANCAMADNMKEISQQHLTISGTLRTTNIIMAGWSSQMWQTILNRVLRAITSGPFSTNFQAASVNIA